MELSIHLNSTCNGGGHVHLTVTKDGGTSRQFVLERNDFFYEPDEYETVLATLIRGVLQRNGFTKATPLAQVKAAIETEVFRL